MMGQDAEKSRITENIVVYQDCRISVQTLNEATNTLRRKTKMSLDAIGEVIQDLRNLVTVHELSEAVYNRGWAIVQRYGLSTYDAMILGCAIENGIDTVLSEDMQDGQEFFSGLVKVINPFKIPDPDGTYWMMAGDVEKSPEQNTDRE